MYVNAKMIPVSAIPGIREGGIKESNGGSESKCDIFDTLEEYLKISLCTHTQQNNERKKFQK
jgi:hypothetical protein